MPKTYSLKVEPYSAAEQRFMDLLYETSKSHKDDQIVCRLGELFGVNYNEYLFGEKTYKAIRSFLKEKES